MEGNWMIKAVLFFLCAAVIMVPIAQRLKIGAVLGYLIAGIAIGPWGLGLFKDVDYILHFSELGVVFLMFLIGLELNPAKLWEQYLVSAPCRLSLLHLLSQGYFYS